ncbi:helix-turn-helix domain-containing protein (plasmid) [Bernardetia sp. Wsw4-3y2]|uniref:helix-turn-helix domain-containing protein n=1 Tax=Bernardetia sp. Wsw4-3y2 TaxID=3127471 RepID=UPI0030D60272
MKKDIQKYNFKEGLPQELEVVEMNQLFKSDGEKLTSTHRTEFYQKLWFQKGTPTHLVDFNPIKIEPHTIVFLNKNMVQRFDNKDDSDGKGILFTDVFFCKTEIDTTFLRSTILFNDLFSIPTIHIPHMESIFATFFEQMQAESNNPNDEYQADILRNYLRNLLLISERERQKQGFTKVKTGLDLDYTMLFKNLLEEKFQEEKLVNYYATQINITQKRLNQATSKTLGKTPKQIIDEKIMLEAKRLLAHTNESVKEIGFTLGFEESTNFIKYFRKHADTTPIEFREFFNP